MNLICVFDKVTYINPRLGAYLGFVNKNSTTTITPKIKYYQTLQLFLSLVNLKSWRMLGFWKNSQEIYCIGRHVCHTVHTQLGELNMTSVLAVIYMRLSTGDSQSLCKFVSPAVCKIFHHINILYLTLNMSNVTIKCKLYFNVVFQVEKYINVCLIKTLKVWLLATEIIVI